MSVDSKIYKARFNKDLKKMQDLKLLDNSLIKKTKSTKK